MAFMARILPHTDRLFSRRFRWEASSSPSGTRVNCTYPSLIAPWRTFLPRSVLTRTREEPASPSRGTRSPVPAGNVGELAGPVRAEVAAERPVFLQETPRVLVAHPEGGGFLP